MAAESLRKYVRVLKLAKKPSKSEFWLYAKLTLLGIAVLGIISFIIKLVTSFFFLGV